MVFIEDSRNAMIILECKPEQNSKNTFPSILYGHGSKSWMIPYGSFNGMCGMTLLRIWMCIWTCWATTIMLTKSKAARIINLVTLSTGTTMIMPSPY
jgi:hypothetical protein